MASQLEAFRGRTMWFWLVLALAVLLRVWIATYNTDANDNHLEVVQRIKATGEMPVVGDCWQCYHVKAFHYTAAVALARLSINNPVDQIRVLQYANVAMGLLTLLLLWTWLSRTALSEKWKLMIFALVALNPRFAAINAEVTNDSLVILAATVSFYCYARFLEHGRFMGLWAALLFAGLAAATKASGLVVAMLVFGHLAVYAAISFRRGAALKKRIGVSALILAAIALAVPYSGYVQNAREAGSPLANNIERFSFPNWIEEKRWSQAGTTSIVSTYLTFRWPGLVAYPYIDKSPILYPEHRTNHWAQLYGRHLFSRFERWPAAWATNGWWTTRVGQAAMVLGLAPLVLLVLGVYSLAGDVLRRLRPYERFKGLVGDPEVFVALTAIAMFAMSLKLSLDFQTFAIMKAIYIYPGFIGIVALLARGVTLLKERVAPVVMNAGHRLLIALLVVHVLDLAILGTDLQAGYASQVQKLATFEPAGLRPGQVPLTRLEPEDSDQLRDKVQINRSFSGLALTGGYRKYRFGLGVQAPSYVEFRVDEKYAYFETTMALADEAFSTDGVQFEIWGDDKRLYRSPMLLDHQVQHVRVDISDIGQLGLKVQPLGSGYGDHANWLHPVLTPKREQSNVDILTQ